jgi:excisionase family DNA binding protein
MQEEVLTTEEIAGYCNVGCGVVHEWIDQGRLKTYRDRPGEGMQIMTFDLIAFLRNNNIHLPVNLQSYSRRVLIAEDESAMANAIQRVLRGSGFKTTIVSDGFQASSVIESFCPAVIVLDLCMPHMKGLEVLQYIRGDNRYSHIKVLVVSAAPKQQLDEARAAGADCVLEKPFDNEVLLAEVEALRQ